MAEPGSGPSLPPPAERVVLWHRRVLRAQKEESTLAPSSTWTRTVVGRCLAGGADIVAQISGTVVATFNPEELFDAIETALDLADGAEDAHVAVAIAISIGETDNDPTSGPPFERAELLAFRAHAGEVALDADSRTRVRGTILFSRQLSGTGAKGYVVDRDHPRRDASGDAMSRLGRIVLPPATAALLPTFSAALESERCTVVLRGPPGAGAHELCAQAAADAEPVRRVLVVGATPGAIAPLGSLRTLLDVWPVEPPSGDAIALLREGGLGARDDLVRELAADLNRVPTLVLFAPLSEVDVTTLELFTLARELAPRTTLVARLGVDVVIPTLLTGSGDLVEFTLPLLRTSDAREIARGLLGEATDADLVRRVAVVGGESALGVMEAARTFISCGDLVLAGDAFTWRGAPRGGASATALEVLIAERFELLDDESRRLLEIAAVLGEGARERDVIAAAKMDNIGSRSAQRAIAYLGTDAWLARGGTPPALRFSSAHARRFVVNALPPARRAELHRFASTALRDGGAPGIPLAALAAWHALEGGREEEGATALLETARALVADGWAIAGAHLASVARFGLTDPVRLAEASAIAAPFAPLAAPSTDDLPRLKTGAEHVLGVPDASAPFAAASDVVGEVRAAIRARDPDELDRIARRAVLEGSDMDAVARLRALADLLRGDVGSAARGLVRARSLRHGVSGLRALVAESMVALRAGEVPAAIRLALRALAEARRVGDARGEAVSLFTLAASYRALGREPDALRLEQQAHG